jgi:outer membrane protein assembly factor BamB
MKLRLSVSDFRKTFTAMHGRLSPKSGNILVYIVMIMVIFAVLGVAMVSLFSTSISSSATANDSRRASYLSEAGIRYAASELRAADFSNTAISTLNDTVYTVSGAGRFDLNVFSPWFEPLALIDIGPGGNDTKVVELPEGELPPGFIAAVPTASPLLTIVNDDYIGSLSPPPSARGTVTGAAEVVGNPKHLQISISDDSDGDGFVSGKNETVCFAVKPSTDQLNVPLPASLQIEHAAAKIFPALGGAFEINRHNYYYSQAIDRTTHVELTGVTAFADEKSPWKDTLNALTTDYVILSPRNRFAVSAGTSGTVTFGNSMDYAAAIADTSRVGPSRKPDFDFEEEAKLSDVLSEIESDSGFAVVDDANRRVIFQKTDPDLPAQFATVWFKDTRAIGGQREFCLNGACFFNVGIRAFFVMTFTGPGDGFTFSLLNAGNNTIASVGGDFELGELMGYAGDSRLNNNSPTPTYLDGTGNGLRPPKMAVEFDGFYNNNPAAYCADATTVNRGTRNDPEIPEFSGSGKDTVQYVFWGSKNPINAPCRANKSSYDDNRHNVEGTFQKWSFDAGARVRTKPAISPSDGTIYVGCGSGSNDGRVYAINPDGTRKWFFDSPDSGDDEFNSSPALDSNGNVYIGSDDNHLYSFNPDGIQRWARQLSGDVEGGSAVDETRDQVYVGTDNKFYARNKNNGDPIWMYPADAATAQFISTASVDPVDGTIYAGSMDGHLYAFNPTGPDSDRVKWSFPTPTLSPIESSPRINPVNGNIYFGSNDNRIYALNRSGAFLWARATSGDVVTTPAVTTDGLTIYAGSDVGGLYAWDSNGNPKPNFPFATGDAVRSSPTIDFDGTVYFGTNGGKLYAVNPDGTLKWTFPSSGSVGAIRSSPTIGMDGIVYVGSDDGHVYAIDPFVEPRNIRGLYLTAAELGVTPDTGTWFEAGPWAVRVEIDRAATPNANGNYDYRLRTWMRQCGNADCTQDMSGNFILGTFFEDTRTQYDYSAIGTLPLTQNVELIPEDHTLFNRLLFGFTSGTGGATQTIAISQFQLSFIRPNDPVVTADPNWP